MPIPKNVAANRLKLADEARPHFAAALARVRSGESGDALRDLASYGDILCHIDPTMDPREFLTDESEAVRDASIGWLRHLPPKEAVQLMRQLVGTSATNTVVHACRDLPCIEARDLLADVVASKLWDDNDPDRPENPFEVDDPRTNAIWFLASRDDVDDRYLADLFRRIDPSQTGTLLYLVKRIEDSQLRTPLLTTMQLPGGSLQDPRADDQPLSSLDRAYRNSAAGLASADAEVSARLVRQFDDALAALPFVKEMGGEDEVFQAECNLADMMMALGRAGGPHARAALLRSLDHDLDDELRGVTFDAMATSRDDAFTPVITSWLEAERAEPHAPTARRAAIGALGGIGSDAAIRALLATTEDADPTTRHEAFFALAEVFGAENPLTFRLHEHPRPGGPADMDHALYPDVRAAFERALESAPHGEAVIIANAATHLAKDDPQLQRALAGVATEAGMFLALGELYDPEAADRTLEVNGVELHRFDQLLTPQAVAGVIAVGNPRGAAHVLAAGVRAALDREAAEAVAPQDETAWILALCLAELEGADAVEATSELMLDRRLPVTTRSGMLTEMEQQIAKIRLEDARALLAHGPAQARRRAVVHEDPKQAGATTKGPDIDGPEGPGSATGGTDLPGPQGHGPGSPGGRGPKRPKGPGSLGAR